MNATQTVYKILDSEAENPLLYSLIKEGTQNILDDVLGAACKLPLWAAEAMLIYLSLISS